MLVRNHKAGLDLVPFLDLGLVLCLGLDFGLCLGLGLHLDPLFGLRFFLEAGVLFGFLNDENDTKN